MSTMAPTFPELLQAFFLQRLINQRNASACTITSYRDTFRLLLAFASERHHTSPAHLTLAELDAVTVLAFLDYLEQVRGNCIRTRNVRLAAIRAFFYFAALKAPTELVIVQAVLAIPMKRFDRPLLGFLSPLEIEAIIAAPDVSTWSGQRDQMLWLLFYNTGARVSELTGARVDDLNLAHDTAICLRGKGRKERRIPLWKKTVKALKAWLRQSQLTADQPLFPNRFGQHLTRAGVDHRLRLAVKRASTHCPSLCQQTVTPHYFRHTTAMHLLQSGVDITVIALWLGHESTSTTHHYIEADLAMKEQALSALSAPAVASPRFQPDDKLLDFLNSL